ncbi:MAG TPA: hypothetical protein DCE42_27345 [Myxococcales bacterium]|nr:hypothetical protein [Deltaproteobacteria bacterium]MBU49687.1 hypothetical protein [Deltaproteobacteria bacterium]HAA58508.1 hypothetical protein [Myxococcales bacterium]
MRALHSPQKHMQALESAPPPVMFEVIMSQVLGQQVTFRSQTVQNKGSTISFALYDGQRSLSTQKWKGCPTWA